MNFHRRNIRIQGIDAPIMKQPLSQKALEIVALMQEVQAHAETSQHLNDDEGNGRKWLQMCNVNNGHDEASPEFTELMGKLSSALNGYLIDGGQHSEVYYELIKAGYRLRTGESDSFGPLSAVFTSPNGEWQVCYG